MAAKSGFTIKPRIQRVRVQRLDEHGNTVVEEVNEWEHPSSADWWYKTQADVCLHNVHVPPLLPCSACLTIPLQLGDIMYAVGRRFMLVIEFKVEVRV